MIQNKPEFEKNEWINPVKKLLKEGKPVFGVTITVNSIEIASQAATMGFDFLWLELEHSPITLETLRNMVLATRNLNAIPIARIHVNELWSAKQVLDAGVLGVIFPFTSTPQLATQAVAACKYPPFGKRGSGASLATFSWPAPQGYYDFADQNILTVAIIEEVKALENIEEIAATPGLDVLFIGTGDLSFSLGLRGDQNHPKLEESIQLILNAGKKHHKIMGRPISNSNDAQKYIDQGFQFFQTPSELNLLSMGAEQFLKPLGKSVAPKKIKMNY